MEKVIKKHLTITSVYRYVDKLGHEIYSQDKGTATFKFTVDELTASKVLCLFYFKYTKRYRTVEATISENTITVPFDSTLITTDEPVVGYVYFEKVEQSTDVYSFAFNVWVSAIDKSKKAPLVERTSGRIVDVENIVTKQELDELFAKIKEQGGTYDDSGLRTEINHISAEIEALKTKTDKDTVYDDSALKQRISALESKTDNDTVYNDTEIKQRLELLEHKPSVNTSELVTKQELESKGYLTQHQSLSNYATKQEIPQPYNDAELKERVSRLENKPDIDTSNFVTNEALNSKGYLTQHQSLEGYAKKSEIPQAYNDTEVKQRLSVVEQKGEGYATKEQLASIPKTPQKLILSGTTLTLSDGGGSVTLPTTPPSNTGGQVNEYEIHGTGMPNGKVTAPIGTTYVDTEVTNGALKWIKESGNGNTGWKVFTGDTRWRTLPLEQKRGSARLQIRRINDQVIVKFDGLSWGWFGLNDLEKIGNSIIEKTIGGKKYTWIKLSVGRGSFVLPEGFRSSSSLLVGLYGDLGDLLGSVYVGGIADSNAIQLRYAMPRNELTNTILSQIRISPITFITDDPWPTN